MNLKINGEDLYINDELYKNADKIADFIIKSMRSKTSANRQTQLFYAVMIALHTKTSQLLYMIDERELDILMKAWEIKNNDLMHSNNPSETNRSLTSHHKNEII